MLAVCGGTPFFKSMSIYSRQRLFTAGSAYLQPAAPFSARQRLGTQRPRVASPSTALGQTALDAANAHAANRALRR